MHIHNTVFDRNSLSPNKYEYDIEKSGFLKSDKIIAISKRVKDSLVNEYKINEDKISVVYWGLDNEKVNEEREKKLMKEKVVLFVGRITMQKGVDYLLQAAKKALDFEKNIRFIVVGSGDMLPQIINKTIELGLSEKINFTGWFNPKEVFKAFQIADLFIMPSVS